MENDRRDKFFHPTRLGYFGVSTYKVIGDLYHVVQFWAWAPYYRFKFLTVLYECYENASFFVFLTITIH